MPGPLVYDPFTPSSGVAAEAAARAAGDAALQVRSKVAPLTPIQGQMVSPPTPTLTASATIVSPKVWVPAIFPGRLANGPFTFTKAGNMQVVGSGYPDYNLVRPNCVSVSGQPYCSYQASFELDDRYLEIMMRAIGGYFQVRVDGQYLTASPVTPGSSGNMYYYYIDFGSRANRRIDFHATALSFGGINTSATGGVRPARVRGPRVIVAGDSFDAGYSTDGSFIQGWVHAFADAMGWDDVWASGVSGTGYLQDNAGTGAHLSTRLGADVLAFLPDVVILPMGLNDYPNFSVSAIVAEAQADIALLQKAGIQVWMIGPRYSNGPGFMPANFCALYVALKALAAANNVPFFSTTEDLFPSSMTPQATTLTAAAVVGTSVQTAQSLVPGNTYAFADGTRFEVKSVTGGEPSVVATVDGVIKAQANGAVVTQVGNSLFTGGGNVSATSGYGNSDLDINNGHPTVAGYAAMGKWIARQVSNMVAR